MFMRNSRRNSSSSAGEVPGMFFQFEERRATIVLSKTRRSWISTFREISLPHPEEYGTVGSPQWRQLLLHYLQSHQPTIQAEDVERWTRRHPWITRVGGGAPSFDQVFQPAAPANNNNNNNPAVFPGLAGVLQEGLISQSSQGSNLPSSSTSGPGVGPQISVLGAEKEKIKRFDVIRDRIMELRELVGTEPELRAEIPALQHMAGVVNRNVRYVVAGKGRAELLHEELDKAGIPHIPKGMKREAGDEDSDDSGSNFVEALP